MSYPQYRSCYKGTPHRGHSHQWSDEYDNYWGNCKGENLDLFNNKGLPCDNELKHRAHPYKVGLITPRNTPTAPLAFLGMKEEWDECPGLEQDKYVWAIDHGLDGEPQIFESEKDARRVYQTCKLHGCKLVKKPNVKVWESVE